MGCPDCKILRERFSALISDDYRYERWTKCDKHRKEINNG